MSILASMSYLQQPATALSGAWLALAFLPAGLFFDFLDGRVARWRGKSSLMGQELDSLADLVGFHPGYPQHSSLNLPHLQFHMFNCLQKWAMA